MKYIKLATPILAVSLLASGIFYANNSFARGCPFLDGGKESKVTISEDQRKAARALVDAAHDTFAHLKHEMFIKKNELKALHNSAFPDVNAVSAKAKEITELRVKMQQEQVKLGEAIDKALGLEPGTHNFKRGMHGAKMGGCMSGHMGRGHDMKGMKGKDGHEKGGHRHMQHQKPMHHPEQPNKDNDTTKHNNNVEG